MHQSRAQLLRIVGVRLAIIARCVRIGFEKAGEMGSKSRSHLTVISGMEAEILRVRISLLSGLDKVLMTMHVEHGASFRQMAALAGVSEATIGRRIRRMSQRLLDGQYIVVERHRERYTSVEMEVAQDFFLLGMSLREIARNRRVSYYLVRKAVFSMQRLRRAKAS